MCYNYCKLLEDCKDYDEFLDIYKKRFINGEKLAMTCFYHSCYNLINSIKRFQGYICQDTINNKANYKELLKHIYLLIELNKKPELHQSKDPKKCKKDYYRLIYETLFYACDDSVLELYSKVCNHISIKRLQKKFFIHHYKYNNSYICNILKKEKEKERFDEFLKIKFASINDDILYIIKSFTNVYKDDYEPKFFQENN